MRRRREPIGAQTIALITIAVCAVGVYFAFRPGLPTDRAYRLDAVFSSSSQLRRDAPVRIAGVTVGKVAAFRPGPGTTRIVTVELDDAARPVHRDATLRIRPRLFLEGGYYVQLDPGTPGAPELRDGADVPLAQTSVPVVLNDVLGALDNPVRGSLRTTLRELDIALGGGTAGSLSRTPRHLAPALRDGTKVARAARGRAPHDLSDTVRSSSRIAAALASRDRELADLVTGLNVTTGAFADESRALRTSVRELDGLLREAPAQLELLDRALPSLTALSRAVRPALRVAPPALRRTAALLGQLEAVSRPAELPRLVGVLRPTLRTLPRFERRATTLFTRVTPVTDCVRDRVAPVLEARLDDGHLSTGVPVWQDLAHFVVGAASTSQGFDGNGHWLRLLGLVGERSVSPGAGLPGTDTLLARADNPILGSRPQPLPFGQLPPLRPDAECRDQPAIDLAARTGAAPPSSPARTAPALDPDRLEELLGR